MVLFFRDVSKVVLFVGPLYPFQGIFCGLEYFLNRQDHLRNRPANGPFLIFFGSMLKGGRARRVVVVPAGRRATLDVAAPIGGIIYALLRKGQPSKRIGIP